MRLSVYVPKEKEYLLQALTDEAERSGRSKNELILEAIEKRLHPADVPAYRTYVLGAGKLDRAHLSADRLDW
jgi:hypothetical protein